ncbi:hypothetical protein R6242_21110 [Iodobacter sp. CM08]|uniref:hypothetical protein n=1 Tax=Iodobacter sp. CM08 TaxID=3085902 RepID=UPI002981651A|nr:hypothetical protein [Iodobacter sp. CM08]MDW5419075.1 hypothetical protein [Iodobacter sp. CM08]
MMYNLKKNNEDTVIGTIFSIAILFIFGWKIAFSLLVALFLIGRNNSNNAFHKKTTSNQSKVRIKTVKVPFPVFIPAEKMKMNQKYPRVKRLY